MFTRNKMARSVILAGIPLLTLPLLAEAGMSRDRSDRMESGRSHSMEQIIQGKSPKRTATKLPFVRVMENASHFELMTKPIGCVHKV